MLIKRSKPITTPIALSRSSTTRDRKQRTELDFSTLQDTEDDEEEDFQPSPPQQKKRSVTAVLDDDDNDDDDDSDFSDDDSPPAHKKARLALKSISNNHMTRRSTTNIPTIGKFIPLTNRMHKPNYDAKSALSKKFKIPTMQIKPPTKKDTNTTDLVAKPKKPNNNAAAMAAATEAANSDFGERKTLGIRRRAGNLRALYDHTAEGAIVLWDPDNDHVEEELKITTDRPQKKGKTLAEILGIKKEEKKMVHVVVDPVLGKVLRPHQVEGVRFLYRCTTGQVHPEANGFVQRDTVRMHIRVIKLC